MRRVEIFNVGDEQENYFIHLARYMFVARQINKLDSVLEIGCGTGYGSRMLADYCSQVVAIDADKSLKTSWEKYSHPNLKFQHQIQDDIFDVVVSFEVVEHIPPSEISKYFDTIKSHLKKGGVLYISTPRALPYEERSFNRQREHDREYSPAEFLDLLRSHFQNVFLFSQNDSIISSQNPAMAWNLVAICVL